MALEAVATCAVFALLCRQLPRPEVLEDVRPRPAPTEERAPIQPDAASPSGADGPQHGSGPQRRRSSGAEVFATDDSSSIGSPLDGRLENGVPVPLKGPGFRHHPRKNQQWRYGTAELVRGLLRAARGVLEALPGSDLTIDDLSAEKGGDIPGHASHRSGRDVDVTFYLLDEHGKPRPGDSIPLDPRGRGTDYDDLEDPADDQPVILDVARTWKFVENLLLDEETRVQRIFVVEHIRALLLEHARKIDAPGRAVERFAEVTCQPASPHDDHMHIRVFCTPDDVRAGCEDTDPIYPWQREYLATAGVAPKLAGPRRGRRPTLTTEAEARAKAGAMHQSVIDFLDRRQAWIRQPHPGREYCP